MTHDAALAEWDAISASFVDSVVIEEAGYEKAMQMLVQLTDQYIRSSGVITDWTIYRICKGIDQPDISFRDLKNHLTSAHAVLLNEHFASFEVNCDPMGRNWVLVDSIRKFAEEAMLPGCVVMHDASRSAITIWCSDDASRLALRMRFGE